MMISAIVLAAGSSVRFQSPKALADTGRGTVIEFLLRTLVATQLSEIIVVTGAHHDRIKPSLLKHNKIRFVYNKDYNFGQTSSFKTGLQNVSPVSRGMMLLPVDCPFVMAPTIDEMMRHFVTLTSPSFLIPTFDARKGHPLFISEGFKKNCQTLGNDVGLNTLIHQHPDAVVLYPVRDPGVVATFNTKKEFEAVKRQLGLA